MSKKWKKKLISLLFALSILGAGIFVPKQEVQAAQYTDAVGFYNAYGSGIVFLDGYFYYATCGKQASASVNTTHWGTVGYRMRVNTSTQSTYIFFSRSGYTVETVNEVVTGGNVYCLYRINLAHLKAKLAVANRTAYNEFLQNGGDILVDSCMVTIKIDGQGNRAESGGMDDWGSFWGSVYTDYNGIASAAPWADPSSLHSYFNKTIQYITQLKLHQTVYVRYQKADGTYGDYRAVVDRDYVYGETVSWSRKEDAQYEKAAISYTATEAKTSHLSVKRKKYDQEVYVKYMDEKGKYGNWELVKSKNLRYGQKFSWSYGGTDCYNAASVGEYTVKGPNKHYIYITRKRYAVNVLAGTGIESVSGGGTYYYGATCTVDAAVKSGYTWTNWSGTYQNTQKRFSFTVKTNTTVTANARANVYYIEFHPNGGSGVMDKLTCLYDQPYSLPVMAFSPPEHPNTYLGWNTDASSFFADYAEQQTVLNLTAEDNYTFHFYAIWDYAPDLAVADRYFTLYEAQNGIITEAELLRTAGSTDREDGTTEIHVKNYSRETFTGLLSSSELIITYTTTDSRNNTTEKQARVTVVDIGDTQEGPMDFNGNKRYVRFISSDYWQNAYESGGMEATSRWKRENTYQDTLALAMNNQKGEEGSYAHVIQTWEFTKEDIAEVKRFVRARGMGNSKDGSALLQFLTQFARCRR